LRIGVIAGNRRRGAGGGGAPFTIAGLFAGGEKGAYYDFGDATKLAVNGDGSGGPPSSGGTVKWAVDLSPNGNHLRSNQSANLATWSAGGITTSGTGYGLFNFAGFGDWANIPQPFEIVCSVEQLTYAGVDRRILSAGPNVPWWLLQGAASGAVRFYDSVYGTAATAGLGSLCTVDGLASGGGSLIGINGGAMSASAGAGQPLNGLVLGSDANGENPTRCRFRRLLVVGRALTAAERAGAVAWASA
jgi:hypothetical protein